MRLPKLCTIKISSPLVAIPSLKLTKLLVCIDGKVRQRMSSQKGGRTSVLGDSVSKKIIRLFTDGLLVSVKCHG
jgi:hypothetical protein